MNLNIVDLGIAYIPNPNAGRPVFFGSIFVGEPGTDPEIEINQKQITLREENGNEVQVSQPVLTGAGGVPLFNGSPVQVLVEGNYSLRVLNKEGSQIYFIADYFQSYGISLMGTAIIFDNVADMVASGSLSVGDYAQTSGYYAPGDGGGNFYEIVAAATGTDDGGSFIDLTVNQAKANFFTGVSASLLQFGAVNDSVTDSTVNVQLAFDYLLSTGTSLDVSGNFAVTTVALDGANGAFLTGRGSLVGIASVATPSVLTGKNVINLVVDGAWFINGNYNTNYDQGLWIYTDNTGSSAFIDMTNLSVVNCKLAWKFGDETRVDDLVSEINIRGGNTFGCPSVLRAVGSQTVINVSNSTLASLTGSGDTAWQALPQKTVVAKGATVNINGGSLLHVLLSTGGSSTTFNILCEVDTIASITTGNIYGKITVTGAIIESASRLASSANSSALTSPSSGSLRFIGCLGTHSQDSSSFVETDPSFLGVITFSANHFFATVARTNPNITCGGLCDIYCDKQSFGDNFKSYLTGIVGGIPHFDNEMVLSVNNLNAQSLTNGVPVLLNFVTKVITGDLERFSPSYLAGIFTIPPGGLKNVRIETQVLEPTLTGEWYVRVNSIAGGVRTLGQYNYNNFSIGSLNAGDTIDITLLNFNATVNAGSDVSDWFHIFASN